MFPDDRVLISVINRKTDLNYLLHDRWYRIPQKRMPDGVYAEYLAFFLSGTASKSLGESGIYYYAKRSGLELAYRKELLPNETSKKARARADDVYYKIQFDDVLQRTPTIINSSKRRFAFIHTTWDRFVNASKIPDLYSTNDYYVDRIYHALRDKKIRLNRYWDAQRKQTGLGANVRILCENGTLTAYTDPDKEDANGVYLDQSKPTDEIFEAIRLKMTQLGGPIYLPLSAIF